MKTKLKNHKIENISSLPILLRNPKILLIGGGEIAYQKAKVLKENSIEFSIITEFANVNIRDLKIPLTIKIFERSDLRNFNIVIDATGSEPVNKTIDLEREKRYFLLNTVDVPAKCDFYFSALLNYGKLKVAVSSDGASPTISQVVRNRIKKFLPKELSSLTELKNEERNNNFIDINSTKEQAEKLFGKVFLVGSGTGDPELLTIKAYKLLQSADVVLYDTLVTKEIIDLIPSNVEKIFAGKPCGRKDISQLEINQLMVSKALQGLRVVRLKSGDPFIFGRLLEEVSFLKENQINFEIVPGISSAIAGPGSAGIPLTARGYSSNVSIVSGSLKKNKLNLDWIELLKIRNHTTVVLMGLKKAGEIVEAAINAGVNLDLPTAIVCNASRPNQRNIYTTLRELPKESLNAESPAIIIFGKVVNLSEIILSQDSAYSNVI